MKICNHLYFKTPVNLCLFLSLLLLLVLVGLLECLYFILYTLSLLTGGIFYPLSKRQETKPIIVTGS